MAVDLVALRRQYESAGIDLTVMSADPLEQFAVWLQGAIDAEIDEPNAMVLSTAGADGPNGRVVLMRGLDSGLIFYTNYRSVKADELRHDSGAAATFMWHKLHRQVRVRGTIEIVDDATSDAYFGTRPRESQIGAWASPQSRLLRSRAELQNSLATVTEKMGDGPIERPPHWGGYRLLPTEVEFWQGQPSRLHDRAQYVQGEYGWILHRLAP
jgi:pyridoxamine 5'-phosphate oxidase